MPWGFAYEMRNALAHGYFTVDLAIVWQTVQNDLPSLRKQVTALQAWLIRPVVAINPEMGITTFPPAAPSAADALFPKLRQRVLKTLGLADVLRVALAPIA